MMINHIMWTLMILTDLCFTKQKIKTKYGLVEFVYNVLVVKVYWSNIKKVVWALMVNSQYMLEKGIIKFENYSKQIPVPFKIHADFECNLRSVESYESSYTKKYQDHVPCSFAYKVVCVDDRFTKPIVVYRGENAAYEFIKAILKEYKYCRKVINKHFDKNLIIREEEEHLFQQSNSSWICEKFIDNDEGKLRDHCHVTGKFRGVAHGSYNINLQLTTKVPVIFHFTIWEVMTVI